MTAGNFTKNSTFIYSFMLQIQTINQSMGSCGPSKNSTARCPSTVPFVCYVSHLKQPAEF